MRRQVRILVGLIALIGGVFAASPLVTAEAAVGEYGPVEWLPVQGSSTLWCTVETQNGCADRYHHDYFAIDISATTSTPIVAAGRGQVTFALSDQPENCPSFDLVFCRSTGREGNKVVVTHSDGVTSYYGHMSRVFVSEGDWVDETTVIGFGGDSGPADGEHLHFEVRNTTGDPITVRSLSACDGSTRVSYPQAFGAATWDQAPAFRSQFEHSGAAACSATTVPRVTTTNDGRGSGLRAILVGSDTGTGTTGIVVEDGADAVGDMDSSTMVVGSGEVILIGGDDDMSIRPVPTDEPPSADDNDRGAAGERAPTPVAGQLLDPRVLATLETSGSGVLILGGATPTIPTNDAPARPTTTTVEPTTAETAPVTGGTVDVLTTLG